MSDKHESESTDWGLVDGDWELPSGGDDLLEAWEEEPIEVEYLRLRNRVLMRGILFVIVTAVSVFSISMTLGDLRYFMLGEEDRIDLGDIRDRRASGQKELDVPVDAYVSLKNQVMTYEAESDEYEYFFDPLYNIITRAPGPLPEKRYYRTVEVPSDLMWLLEDRKAFAVDLTAGFDGTGRLVRADAAPRWVRSIYDAYSDIVRLPPDQVYVFLADTPPSAYRHIAIAYAIAAVLFFFTAFLFVRAARNLLRVRRELA